MALKKKAKVEVENVVQEEVIPTTIAKLSVDYGREDLNTIARTVNQIIDALQK